MKTKIRIVVKKIWSAVVQSSAFDAGAAASFPLC